MIADLIEEMLMMYGLKINGYVYETEDKEQGITSINKLFQKERMDKKALFIINEVIPERLIRARENIERGGIFFGK